MDHTAFSPHIEQIGDIISCIKIFRCVTLYCKIRSPKLRSRITLTIFTDLVAFGCRNGLF